MATIEFEEDAIRIDATIIGQGLGEAARSSLSPPNGPSIHF
jgi:hypothetical protein